MKKTLLRPIERTEKDIKRVKNTWCGEICYLTDLKTRRSSLITQLQNDTLALV